MKRIDYHLHTRLCKHARGTIDEYVAQALSLDLDEIGFSDHNPMLQEFARPHRMDPGQFDRYVAMVREAQKKFPRLPIKLGLEADFLPGGEDFLKEQISRYPFDYVYGSVHYLGEWGFDDPVFIHVWDDYNVDNVYTRYFEALMQLIESRLFDIIAHPDLVKKFGHRPKNLDMESIYHRVCRCLKEASMCMEVNTAGLRKEVGEIYPVKRFLEIAYEHDVPIVIGSDAHAPEEVGKDYDRAVALARSAGYTHIQQFSRRRRTPVSIEDQ